MHIFTQGHLLKLKYISWWIILIFIVLSKISHFLWNEYIFFAWPMDPWKSQFKGPKYIISKSSFVRKRKMWWYRRGNSGGSWLPEEKKKQICGTEEEIVVAHGRLPPPLHGQELGNEQERLHEYLLMNSLNKNLFMNSCMKKNLCVQCKLYTLQCTLHNEYYSIYSVQITWNDAQGKWIKSLTRSEEPFKFLDSTLTTWYNLTWSK